LRALLILFVVSTAATASELRCDSVGVAQFIIPDLLAHNPGAKKLGLSVEEVRLIGVLPAPDNDTCLVEVTTNHGYVMKYKFRYDGDSGTATLDLIP
jgi:hypothetical protein